METLVVRDDGSENGEDEVEVRGGRSVLVGRVKLLVA